MSKDEAAPPAKGTEPPKDKDAPPAPPTQADVAFTVKHNLQLLDKAVTLLEPRFTTRAIRGIPALRKQLSGHPDRLADVISSDAIYPADSPRRASLLEYLGNPVLPSASAEMEVDDVTPAPSAAASTLTSLAHKTTPAPSSTTTAPPAAPLANLPEADVYVSLLVLLHLLDSKAYDQAKSLAKGLIADIGDWNRRTMDQLASKAYFFWVRVWEASGEDTAALRTSLLAAQRTAALRHDDDLQATLLPLLLRNYLQHHLYDQADRLVSKTTFPEGTAGNAQIARWYYYVGRIRAIQLNYTEAHSNLQQAIRRAPEAKAAPGFLQTAHKLSIIVELLMGEIPERSIFRQPVLKSALKPYLEIVQAVRTGSITTFNEALANNTSKFQADHNTSLIVRLRHNVIKTALRTISLAYSRIPLADVSAKLHLNSEEDAEYIVAKAIRDGVIDAVVDHEKGFMMSKEAGDVYATNEPQQAFDTRIKFLLELHNQSVKAMRYPLNAHAKELASAGEARERERELAKEIEEDGDADMDGGDMFE
ncbi:26S proteasome non-atpase regulatory subunit 3 [Pseudohyphozyma bogoriensis]|nr:26S proteasome non-atpase regulatory subunit 3 [Pseudohyphozyma bogoriensis]